MGGRLCRGLFLGMPIDGKPIEEIQDAGDRVSREAVVVQVRVDTVNDPCTVAKRRWCAWGKELFHIAMCTAFPFAIIDWNSRWIGFMRAHAELSMLHFGQALNDTFGAFQVSNPWHGSVRGQCHNSRCHVKSG